MKQRYKWRGSEGDVNGAPAHTSDIFDVGHFSTCGRQKMLWPGHSDISLKISPFQPRRRNVRENGRTQGKT